MSPDSQQAVFHLPVDKADGLCHDVLLRLGLSECELDNYVDSIMFASLRGIDSHGIASVLPRSAEELYGDRIHVGYPIVTRFESATTARLDGNEGPGPTVGIYAMDLACEKAASSGLGAVTVGNCNHFGAASFYAMRALERNQIGLVVCNSDPRVAPYGGSQGALGTNPIAYAVPAGEEPPIVFDVATSVVAAGQIAKAGRQGKQIPLGWALDANGRPTTDPIAAYAGTLLPMAGHKGYGLGLLVDVLSGALAGSLCGPRVPRGRKGPRGQSFFFLAIDVAHFLEVERFTALIDQLIRDLRAVPPAEGFSEVILPGEIELRQAAVRKEQGIPLQREEWDQMLERLSAVGVPVGEIVEKYEPVASW